MAFEIIDTQEKFDAAIAERLRRERETVSKKYADYDDLKKKTAEYEATLGTMTKEAEENAKKYSEYDKKLADLQAKVKGYETGSVKTRIAHETGIPFELAERLSGDTEEEIRKDAETLSKFIGGVKKSAPLRNSDSGNDDSKTSALRAFTASLVNNND
ncbi:MAG: DUF4355 domain-containing protein [Clostridia bacterium]|nr:DUF4355 domain-containing protein [Clostridia bacterium]